MKPHKWAKEIIHWANGGEIEIRVYSNQGCDWSEWKTFEKETKPLWSDDEDMEYRIKPQPKEPQYLYAYEAGGVVNYSRLKSEQMPFFLGDRMIPSNYIGKIKLDQDDD